MCARRATGEGLGREGPLVRLACCRPPLPASKQRQARPSMSSLVGPAAGTASRGREKNWRRQLQIIGAITALTSSGISFGI
jgi:hypothetical protein